MRSVFIASLLVAPTTAVANPCGKTVPTETVVAQNWVAAHQTLNGGKPRLKSDAAATKSMCSGAPCGPNEPFSLVHAEFGQLMVAVANPPGSFTLIKVPLDVPPTIYDARLTRLSDQYLHVHLQHEEFGREMFCEEADLDKNGECTEGRTATVSLGHSVGDALIHIPSRSVAWTRSLTSDEPGGLPGRSSGVLRLPTGLFGTWGFGATSPTEWFRLDGGKCAPAAPPLDFNAKIKAARDAARKGMLPPAIGIFGALETLSPGHAGYLSERGYLRFKAGDREGAATDYAAALKATPDDKLSGVIFFNRGLLKEAQGDKKGALDDFQEADRRRPSKAAKAKIKALGG